MPEPLSVIVTDVSGWMVISIVLARPAMASSTALSITSYASWCSPRGPVEPMYMPGRSRTGSRPSRTVMSLAVYVALVIKKALQVAHFRARGSVSDRTVVSGPCEARLRSLFYRFAQIFRLDAGGPAAGLLRHLQRGFRER